MHKKHSKYKDYVEVCQGPWSGFVHVDFQDIPIAVLADPDVSDEHRGPFEKVGSSHRAEVYRYFIEFQRNRETLYLKKYPHRSPLDALKHIFRPSRAQRAFRAALTLEQNGLFTPRVIAFLQKKDGDQNAEDILITQGMTNSTVLSEVLASTAGNRETVSLENRRAMITAFGQMIARMHAAGICHGDLRWGNIFVSQEGSTWEFHLIDNERTQRYPVLPFWLRRKNLVQLNMAQNIVTLTDRFRFLRAYAEASGMNPHHIARIIIKGTVKRLRVRAKSHIGFADDNLQTHWNFQGARFGNYDGFFLRDFCKGDKAAGFLQQIETLTETGHVLKNDTATRVVRCTYNNQNVVIKRYNHQGLWHSLRHTLKGSRAKKCWRFGHMLDGLHIPCAAPIGVVEEWRYGLIWQSYILNEFIEGPNIKDYLRREDLPENKKREILTKTQDLVSRLAKNRLVHNDLKPCNLLVHNGNPVLIDLDSMQQHRNRWILSLYKRKMDNKIRERIFNG